MTFPCQLLAFAVVLVLYLLGIGCHAFAPSSPILPTRQIKITSNVPLQRSVLHRTSPHGRMPVVPSPPSPTTLHNGVIIDVDDNFFTIAFFSIGFVYALGKAYNRFLLEEVAFEQRKLESRERRLAQDPTVSEYDLRREESASWPSVYARSQWAEGETRGDGTVDDVSRSNRRSRVTMLERDDEDEKDDYKDGMSDEEIEDFESRFGVEYDPYYDEPYEESELPLGKYQEDKSYGDRRYENGEVFYKDENTGKFFRQGSRPRQRKFWDMNSSP